jgi:hypothetical protein
MALPLGNQQVDPYAAWDAMLTQPAVTPFSEIAPFHSEYCFGWEGVNAGAAKVHIGVSTVNRRIIEVEGGPNTWVRKLWNYHAFYFGETGIHGETPSWFHMEETLSKRDLLSDAIFAPDSVFACHRLVNEKKLWERIALPGVRDFFSAMLFVRSQRLHLGDRLRLTVFPDQNPYLVDLTVTGRNTILVAGEKIPAICLTIQIQTIETHGVQKGRLAPHRKFHSGRVWISDDPQRLPLRAEVDIFIGRVFVELVSCKKE